MAPRTSSLEWTEVEKEVPAHVERLEAQAAPPMGSGWRLRLEFYVGKGFIIYPLLPLIICSVTNVSSSDECNICEKNYSMFNGLSCII
jgi:hypothetical protein